MLYASSSGMRVSRIPTALLVLTVVVLSHCDPATVAASAVLETMDVQPDASTDLDAAEPTTPSLGRAAESISSGSGGPSVEQCDACRTMVHMYERRWSDATQDLLSAISTDSSRRDAELRETRAHGVAPFGAKRGTPQLNLGGSSYDQLQDELSRVCEGKGWGKFDPRMRATCASIIAEEGVRRRMFNLFSKAEKDAVAGGSGFIPVAQLARYVCVGSVGHCSGEMMSIRSTGLHNSDCVTCLRIAKVTQHRRRQMYSGKSSKYDFDLSGELVVDAMCNDMDFYYRLRDLKETRKFCERLRDDHEDALIDLFHKRAAVDNEDSFGISMCVHTTGSCRDDEAYGDITQSHAEL